MQSNFKNEEVKVGAETEGGYPSKECHQHQFIQQSYRKGPNIS